MSSPDNRSFDLYDRAPFQCYYPKKGCNYFPNTNGVPVLIVCNCVAHIVDKQDIFLLIHILIILETFTLFEAFRFIVAEFKYLDY